VLRVVVASIAICVASVTGAPVTTAAPDDPPPPPVTVNEFLPEDRDIGDCLSSLPQPGCGSDARGGWRQTIVLVAILGGLGVITWRVVAGARRARRLVPGDGSRRDEPEITPER
jgi:hypothetical protein